MRCTPTARNCWRPRRARWRQRNRQARMRRRADYLTMQDTAALSMRARWRMCPPGRKNKGYRKKKRRFVPNALNQLTEGAGTRAAGIIRSLRAATTQRGKMWIVMLDDGAGQCEITLFDELAAAHRNLLTEDALLIVAGSARHDAF